MVDCFLVCPTHRRTKVFMNKTWKLLQKTNAPKPILWVKDDKDVEDYTQLNLGLTILKGGNNIAETRNLIQDFFPLNTKIIMIDDDIKNIVVSEEHNKKRDLTDFNSFASEAFALCEKYNTSLFGVYPVDNSLFMKPNIRTNLCYINGSLFGIINKRIHTNIDIPNAEDNERSIRHFILEKKVLRLEFIGISTRYYKEQGGLQITRTDALNTSDKEALVKLFPELCKTIIKKKSNKTEIAFIKSRQQLIPYNTDNIL